MRIASAMAGVAGVVAAIVGLASPAFAENWPGWRGPLHNGSSPETGLPLQWSTNRNVAWTAPLPGHGAATPAVWNDTVFVSTADTNRNLVLLAFDRTNGAVRWQRPLGTGDFSQGHNNLASPSPVTDGRIVCALYGSGDLAALDFSGRVLWARNLGADFGRFSIMWLYGSSPLLHDGRLYVQVLQRNPSSYKYSKDDRAERDSYLLCVDPATGKDLWRHVRRTDASDEAMEAYTTPVPFAGAKGEDLLAVVGGDYVTAHLAATGEELWRCGGLNPKRGRWMRVVPTPVAGAGMIFACGPKREAVIAIRDGGRGDVTSTHTAWTHGDVTSDCCTPLFYRGRLYLMDGDKKRIACLDPVSGAVRWTGVLPVGSILRASPTGADGRVYCLAESGEVVVLEAGDEFRILATAAMGDGPCRASIVVAQGRLFIRTSRRLWCIGG